MEMNALVSNFNDTGFSLLGFPCNNFALKEPGANYAEILNGIKYVRPGGGFVPNFQLFKKIDVNGENEHPLYTYLKSMCGPTSDIFRDRLHYNPKRVSDVRWNFEAFLVDRKGKPLYRYSPGAPISEIESDIIQLVHPGHTEDQNSPIVQPIVDSNESSDETEYEQEPVVESADSNDDETDVENNFN